MNLEEALNHIDILEREIRILEVEIANNAIERLNDNRDMKIKVLEDFNKELKLRNDFLENMMYEGGDPLYDYNEVDDYDPRFD